MTARNRVEGRTSSHTAFPQLLSLQGRVPRVRLVVVEEDANSFGSPASEEDWDETIVVVQFESEPWSIFTRRVMQRMADVARSGRAIGSLVVLVGRSADAQALHARSLVAHALAMYEHPLEGGPCELVFAIDEHVTLALRHGLLNLTERLVSELARIRRGLAIRLRFGTDGAPSPRSPTRPQDAA